MSKNIRRRGPRPAGDPEASVALNELLERAKDDIATTRLRVGRETGAMKALFLSMIGELEGTIGTIKVMRESDGDTAATLAKARKLLSAASVRVQERQVGVMRATVASERPKDDPPPLVK